MSDELVEEFVEALADLCEESELTCEELIEPLVFVLAETLAQITSDQQHGASLVKEVGALLINSYLFHCDPSNEESANITIQ